MDEEVNPNIKCSICGENEFEQREGFYYCLECGTKQEQVRQVEVDNEDAFNDTVGTKHSKSTKIKVVKAEKPQLTSWECYNYILRGYVEELLSFGAKEELKLMALQLWAAYLRRMEVAFFNKKKADLPKLGVRYYRNDAETIYNHSKEVRKQRKRKRGDDTSGTSGGEEMSGRSWRKNKRKLDESIYSSATSASSTSANSNKAIKLTYSMKARKFLKKKMSVKHLLRHEMDGEGLMQCHSQPKVSELKRLEHEVMVMSIKQIYCILAIALNLIGDDIQLTDMVRFIQEGHIGWKNVLQYFPENIACNGKEMLKKIDFYKFPEKYTEKRFREHVSLLSKNIGIKYLKTPNIIGLVQRYVTELCLPHEIKTYAERLINFLPPKFKTRSEGYYSAYEARAMAYIIFILKLLFGLDGHKEHRMSKAAKKLNLKIKELNRKNRENKSQLFVWDEWRQYIEMRKVIVSHYNPTFCKQFQQGASTAQILQQMSENIRQRQEQEQSQNDNATTQYIVKRKLNSFKYLFDTFLENYTQQNETPNASSAETHIEFKTTFTPGLTYFKNILLHCDNTANEPTFKIPPFMRTDHAQRDMQSYLEVKPLMEYFQNNRKELKINSLDTTKNRNYSGIFRAPRSLFPHSRIQQADFDISEKEWAEKVAKEVAVNTDHLDWKTDLDLYAERYFKMHPKYVRRRNTLINGREEHNDDFGITIQEHQTGNTQIQTFTRNIESLHEARSIDVFNENNMDPLKTENAITGPRRDLGRINIFMDIEDEDSLIDNNETSTSHSGRNDTLSSRAASPSQDSIISRSEIYIKSEFIPESSNQDPETLKFYTSNMDCWMLFGNILMLTKPQLKQLQDKLPSDFFWLLETCAQTLGVDWSVVYEQLLVIELMFCMGIEDLDNVENCVFFNYKNRIKDFQVVINSHRDIW